MSDGGPAFPQNDLTGYGIGPAKSGNGGMDLRDYFAGQALLGYMASDPSEYEAIAKSCFQVADFMLAERAKVKP